MAALKIRHFSSPSKAPNYLNEQNHQYLTLEQFVIVDDGTLTGEQSVDLVLYDKKGNCYTAMLTANILRAAWGALNEF